LLLYRLPSTIDAGATLSSLHDCIEKDAGKASKPHKPDFGGRFRLAHALAASILAIHSSGWVHKNIRSRSVLLLLDQIRHGKVDPCLLGWGTSRAVEADTNLSAMFELEHNLHQHKDRFGQPNSKFAREHDIYSLGVVLLEIGIWRTMSSVFANRIQTHPNVDVKGQAGTFKIVNGHIMDRTRSLGLRQEMGLAYAQVVETCLTWPSTGPDTDTSRLAIDFRTKVVDALVTGCRL